MTVDLLLQIGGFSLALFGVVWKLNKDHEDSRSRMHDRIDEVMKQHQDERVYVAEKYMKKEEMTRLEDKIDRLQESITNVLQKSFKDR